MHGIVNQSIKDLVVENYGEDKWKAIAQQVNIVPADFINHHNYNDSLTYQLVETAAEVLSIQAHELLHAFGKHWILYTGKRSYGDFLKSGGRSLRDFLIHLPNFHSRIMLLFPEIEPPEFITQALNESEVEITYLSHRSHLGYFMEGLLDGLIEMYDEPAEVQTVFLENQKAKFKVIWK